MKKILYILSGNLSTTPRALQSLKTAKNHYEVQISAVNRLNIWRNFDDLLVIEYHLNYKLVSLQRKPFFNWFLSSAIHKIARIVYPLFVKNIKINAYASSKTMFLLEKELKRNRQKYDLIIAHSYSSLYPAYQFAKKHKIPFIFDIEDYHPGEKCADAEKKRREFLMKKLLPSASCITYASPLIGEYSFKLLENGFKGDRYLINNSFPQKEFQFKESTSEKIKFVWFSQNISAGRGLEMFFPALEKFKNKIEVSLVGNLNQDFYQEFLSPFQGFIKIHNPLNQNELNLQLADYDIGLAIELDNADFNRQICLTNKIFAYTQSGLYILATNTLAQEQFLLENQQLGVLTEQTISAIEKQIEFIIQNIQSIREQKKNRFEYAKKLSWEHESQKLLKLLEVILTDKPDSV